MPLRFALQVVQHLSLLAIHVRTVGALATLALLCGLLERLSDAARTVLCEDAGLQVERVALLGHFARPPSRLIHRSSTSEDRGRTHALRYIDHSVRFLMRFHRWRTDVRSQSRAAWCWRSWRRVAAWSWAEAARTSRPRPRSRTSLAGPWPSSPGSRY